MGKKKKNLSIKRLSVIVPENPFLSDDLKARKQCLCALNVEDLLKWWPGQPHSPHRDPKKVRSIQRSLDWKRVAQIASYLLQSEITDVPGKIDKYFKSIYEPKKYEPGREWPPRVKKIVGYEKSEFPVFSNVLLHVNGAEIDEFKIKQAKPGERAASLIFDENDPKLNFFVVDGQHRINGAYLALKIKQENPQNKNSKWEIPAQIFLDLDLPNHPPKQQAQIFIDVNFYQKKVDRSLVADLFPTTRADRDSMDFKERAQDLGRKLMLEQGPLVGMIQIPGIRYGVKDVVTLATLNSGIEDILSDLHDSGIESLEGQTEFLAQLITCWLNAAGRFETLDDVQEAGMALDPENVVYQGRVLVSVIALTPAILWKLCKKGRLDTSSIEKSLTLWFKEIIERAGLSKNGKFLSKSQFKEYGYLGSGGIGRFRNTLWASILTDKKINHNKPEIIEFKAEKNKKIVLKELKKRQK